VTPPADRPGPGQLAFDLPHASSSHLADFISGESNRRPLEFLLAWPDWPHPAAVLSGPSGSGKSHLARIWADRAGADVVQARDIAGAATAADRPRRLVVEDLERGALDERALFHLFNLCVEPGGALLVTANAPPARLALSLPDLVSRLRAARLVEIDTPDDGLIEAVLVKLFADRQLEIGPDITAFALARMERSLEAARALVARVDQLGLAESRRVSKRLVARALQEMPPSAGG
jgi:chromosomal replication initiation ATPase DnaA